MTAAVRNLTVESLVDTATAEARQLNLSGSIGTDGFSASGSTQKATGDAAIVSEQSGIHAGTGGLDLTIDKKTTLVGALITSEAPANLNHLETGTLDVADIDTHSRWKADTYGASIGSGGLSLAKVNDGESATGKAYSAIGGTIGITITDPEHQTQDIGTIRRDTENTNTSLPGLPDLQNILRDQYKTQADLQEAQKTMAGLVGDIASDLYKQAFNNKDQAGIDLWKEGGQGRALLHAIGGGILGGVNGWEGAIKAALGGAATTLMAPAIAELVKGMLKGTKYEGTPEGDALAKLIGATLAAGVGGVVGGAEGAGYGAANYQYNYLDHADNDALNAAKAACDASKGTDTRACAEKTQLEAKDNQQQDTYVACRTSGFQAAGCDAVFTNMLAALSSYSGTASWLLPEDQYQAALKDLQDNGGLVQIWKIMAADGINKLSEQEKRDASKLIGLLIGDPSGFTAIPSLIVKANNGDPLALVQVLTFFARFKAGNFSDSLPNNPGNNVNKTDDAFLDSTTASGDSVYHDAMSTAIGDDLATKRNFYNAIDTGNGHNVIVHGGLDYDEIGGIPFVNGRETNPAQIAEAVRANPNYTQGSQVCFASCWSGTSGTAQQLADELKAPVFAPSRPVAWDSVANNWVFDTDVFGIGDVPRPDIKPIWQMFYPSGK